MKITLEEELLHRKQKEIKQQSGEQTKVHTEPTKLPIKETEASEIIEKQSELFDFTDITQHIDFNETEIKQFEQKLSKFSF